MKKVLPIVIIIVLIAAVAAVVIAKRNSDDKSSTGNTSQTTTTGSGSIDTTNNATSTPVSTNSVSIKDMAFSPAHITVKKGTTVTWTNQDSAPHQPMADSGQDGPKSDVLSNGKSYSFTYNTVGTFSYHCNIHSSMTGTVTVTE